MRIGVDARHLAGGRGVARYAQGVLDALVAAWPEASFALLVPGPPTRDSGPAPVRRPNVTVVRTALPGRVVFGAAAATGRPRLERLLGGGIDVAWLPAPAPVAIGVPYVVTVHDLSFEQRPRDFTAYERAWHRAGRLRRQAQRAARVVAVSGPTRDAVVERWGVAAGRIDVVHPGVWRDGPAPDGAAPGGAAHDGAAPARPYLLCVAALEPRKAPELLAGAYARARARGLDADLVLAGGGRLADRLAGRPGVRLLGPVEGARLDALYRGALAVVLPSWLEGFGLPPLEGLARGVPAVVADLPVYRETLGDGALRFAPGDAAGLADALLAVARDPALRERLVAAGQDAIAPLTWERSAAGIRAALEQAAAGR